LERKGGKGGKQLVYASLFSMRRKSENVLRNVKVRGKETVGFMREEERGQINPETPIKGRG